MGHRGMVLAMVLDMELDMELAAVPVLPAYARGIGAVVNGAGTCAGVGPGNGAGAGPGAGAGGGP